MFNVKAINKFDQTIIDQIMALFRTGGLIPKVGDTSPYARDFEPAESIVASFHQIRKNCHDLCHGTTTPIAGELIGRYLKLEMTLNGVQGHRTFGAFMDTIVQQIATGRNPDFDQTGWPPFNTQGLVPMHGYNLLPQQAAYPNQVQGLPDLELMKQISVAIKAMAQLNGFPTVDVETDRIALHLMQQGITDPVKACIAVYKNSASSWNCVMKLAPDRGSSLDYVKLVIAEEQLKLNPFDMISIEQISDVAERIILGLIANPTFTRDEVIVELKKDQTDTTIGRIYRIVYQVLEREGYDRVQLKDSATRLAQALMQRAPEFAHSSQYTKAVIKALAELRDHISVHDGGTLALSLNEHSSEDDHADSALLEDLADSALMLAGIEPTQPERVSSRKVELEGYHFEREDDFHVITREYGLSPTGNPLQGAWVCRNYHTGAYIDHDRYRNDLFERLNVSRLENV